MNADLLSLSSWLNLNKLKYRTKTKYMIVTFKKNINTNLYKIMIGADELQRVEDIKYLAVVIDNKLRLSLFKKK
jgi:hypothetical protein